MRGEIPIACRFYLVGKCNKASECSFLHDKSAPVSLLCSKFLSGKCSFNKDCKFIHSGDIDRSFANVKSKMCRSFYEHGFCRNRFNCPNIHGELCTGCALYAILPGDIDGKVHQQTCKMEMANMCKRYSFPSLSKTCSVCHLSIVESGQRFAIMECCNHVFCTPCIRKWRTTLDQPKESTKGCPVCRVVSPMFVPSDYWIPDDVEKQIFLAEYRSKLSKIRCRYISSDQDICPFGIKCMYSHVVDGIDLCRGNPGLRKQNDKLVQKLSLK